MANTYLDKQNEDQFSEVQQIMVTVKKDTIKNTMISLINEQVVSIQTTVIQERVMTAVRSTIEEEVRMALKSELVSQKLSVEIQKEIEAHMPYYISKLQQRMEAKMIKDSRMLEEKMANDSIMLQKKMEAKMIKDSRMLEQKMTNYFIMLEKKMEAKMEAKMEKDSRMLKQKMANDSEEIKESLLKFFTEELSRVIEKKFDSSVMKQKQQVKEEIKVQLNQAFEQKSKASEEKMMEQKLDLRKLQEIKGKKENQQASSQIFGYTNSQDNSKVLNFLKTNANNNSMPENHITQEKSKSFEPKKFYRDYEPIDGDGNKVTDVRKGVELVKKPFKNVPETKQTYNDGNDEQRINVQKAKLFWQKKQLQGSPIVIKPQDQKKWVQQNDRKKAHQIRSVPADRNFNEVTDMKQSGILMPSTKPLESSPEVNKSDNEQN